MVSQAIAKITLKGLQVEAQAGHLRQEILGCLQLSSCKSRLNEINEPKSFLLISIALLQQDQQWMQPMEPGGKGQPMSSSGSLMVMDRLKNHMVLSEVGVRVSCLSYCNPVALIHAFLEHFSWGGQLTMANSLPSPPHPTLCLSLNTAMWLTRGQVHNLPRWPALCFPLIHTFFPTPFLFLVGKLHCKIEKSGF